jgi:hypothetical protein
MDRVNNQDDDPGHAECSKPGAARVVVPDRPGYEDAVAYFLEKGQLWEGGDLPKIGSPLYVDILEEIKERQKAPGKETPVVEPWEFRLPTTLVRLAASGNLPKWEKDDEGKWHPVQG